MAKQQLNSQLTCPGLSLAVYREVVAHLRQVDGVDAGLIPQASQQFDYYQSQVSGLWIEYADASNIVSRERVQQILAHYQIQQGDRSKLK